ncbi:MAG: UDP-glucose/GDP-mannose dehydrogenase family protein [Kiritimatiellia bacterium]|jgi:UDPglucose 6-dehydrogenase|nr:UDP-glucose/GDP-mannose dehydrogenase family protein [Kiritimatiellia bacterium]MDP6631030.1 UDP-glucose/GDP-mannose dehydrogenase family protein [Kiritimatiellia bacterium]MDP6809986.1 UDP-glucose/GDP-mannose dehydrogenase family protein [Kiritimatiellia bacterium]MDP7024757.1 UDP-glucose/GDP-mannose dehydrogenase family protein [Kiritimatiellia bacterium]
MKITIVGTGYVGLVTGTTFAEIGHDVLCVDNDTSKIDKLESGIMPIYEEGLEEMVLANVKAGRLKFSTSVAEGTAFAEVIFIAVGTPPGYQGEANMSYVESVGREVAEHMTSYRLLVEKSTVIVNTNEQLTRTMNKYLKADIPFDIASNPEFLREGTAIKDAFKPDRVVVGVESDRAGDLLREIYAPIVEKSGCEYLQMDIASAELTKHASNSFLAMKISFINAVSRICELTGADITQVAHGMGLDARIGEHFLKAGVGYGGSCFPKDVDAFVRMGDEVGYRLDLLKEVQSINKQQREHVMRKLKQEMWVLQNKRVAIFGLAFKPGTDDIRESPSLYFVPQLQEQKASLCLWDPIAREKFNEEFPGLDYNDDLLECAKDADVLLILTDWPEIRELDLAALKDSMRCPIVVDGRNVFDAQAMDAQGFTYHSVGRP